MKMLKALCLACLMLFSTASFADDSDGSRGPSAESISIVKDGSTYGLTYLQDGRSGKPGLTWEMPFAFNQKLTLQALLEALGSGRSRLAGEWLEALDVPTETGRISLRDGVVLVLAGKAHDVATTLKRMGASGDFEMSLPEFAHALFRQEQAVQLTGVPNE